MNEQQFNELEPGVMVQVNKEGFDFIKDEVVRKIGDFIECRNTGCWDFNELDVI